MCPTFFVILSVFLGSVGSVKHCVYEEYVIFMLVFSLWKNVWHYSPSRNLVTIRSVSCFIEIQMHPLHLKWLGFCLSILLSVEPSLRKYCFDRRGTLPKVLSDGVGRVMLNAILIHHLADFWQNNGYTTLKNLDTSSFLRHIGVVFHFRIDELLDLNMKEHLGDCSSNASRVGSYLRHPVIFNCSSSKL